jgi:hypothetical protein
MRKERSGACGTVGERRNAYRVLVGRTEGKNYLEDTGVDGRVILEWIFKKWDGGTWAGLFWLRIGTDVGIL